MTAVYKKELRSYFCNPVGYVFIGLLLCVVGVCVRLFNLKSGGYPQFEYAISGSGAGLIYILLIPILTMRSLSEERRQKTDQLLFALPIGSADVVLGKFFAMSTVLAIPTGVMCLYPLILHLYGDVNFAGAYCSILMFYLLGVALTALCMFLSSLTESQLIAAVTGAAAVLLIFMLDTVAGLLPATALASVMGYLVLILLFSALVYRLLSDLNLSIIVALALSVVLLAVYLLQPNAFLGSFASLLRSFALFSLLDNGIYGSMFDLTTVVMYLSVTAAFLFFSVRVLEKRRWN